MNSVFQRFGRIDHNGKEFLEDEKLQNDRPMISREKTLRRINGIRIHHRHPFEDIQTINKTQA
jgi:hypothetical protein